MPETKIYYRCWDIFGYCMKDRATKEGQEDANANPGVAPCNAPPGTCKYYRTAAERYPVKEGK